MSDLFKKNSSERVQHTIKFLETLLNASIDGILLTDVSQNIILVNKAFCNMVEYRREDLIETNLLVWLEKFEGNALNTWIALENNTQLKGSIQDVAFQKMNKNGIIDISVNASILEKIAKEERGFILSIWRDVSNSKIAERKLLNEKRIAEKASNRANFYKNLVIHDISNVIQNIGNSWDLFLNLKDKPGNLTNINHLSTNIKDSVKRGRSLIFNVRKLAQIENAKTILKPIELCAVLKNSIDFLKKSFQEKGFIINIESPHKHILVKADELLSDVFDNLLINAGKHNDNPQIRITVKIQKITIKNIDFTKLEFIDDGIGVSDELKNTIFEKGYKKNSMIKGMGIGLSLVKEVIENYGGQIWVEDNVPGDSTKGSNFNLLIPRAVK